MAEATITRVDLGLEVEGAFRIALGLSEAGAHDRSGAPRERIMLSISPTELWSARPGLRFVLAGSIRLLNQRTELCPSPLKPKGAGHADFPG